MHVESSHADGVPAWFGAARQVLRPLARYHQHTVVGLEHIPREGPVLGLVNHSLATYDALLFGLAVLDGTGRIPKGLGDDLLFKVPGLAWLTWDAGIRPASHAHGERLLRDGELLWIAPGGMREALRPSRERYSVKWGKRRGFARLAVRTGAPVVLAACPGADDIYTVYGNPVTAAVYRAMRVPLPVARGVGPTAWPRPVALTHHVAPAVYPPAFDPSREEEQVEDLHADLVRRMERLLRPE